MFHVSGGVIAHYVDARVLDVAKHSTDTDTDNSVLTLVHWSFNKVGQRGFYSLLKQNEVTFLLVFLCQHLYKLVHAKVSPSFAQQAL